MESSFIIKKINKYIKLKDYKELIKNYKYKIDNIENCLGKYFDEKLKKSYSSKSELIRCAIFNDTIDLVEDIYRDLYFINMQYNVEIAKTKTFRAYYYYYNICEKTTMIYERLVILIAFIYSINTNIEFHVMRQNYFYRDARIRWDRMNYLYILLKDLEELFSKILMYEEAIYKKIVDII